MALKESFEALRVDIKFNALSSPTQIGRHEFYSNTSETICSQLGKQEAMTSRVKRLAQINSNCCHSFTFIETFPPIFCHFH